MRWKSGRRSSNIEDHRGVRISKKTAAGGGITTIVLVLVAMYFGVDPNVVMQVANPNQGTEQHVEKVTLSAEEQELTDFVSVVLADTEDTCMQFFSKEARSTGSRSWCCSGGLCSLPVVLPRMPWVPFIARPTKRYT